MDPPITQSLCRLGPDTWKIGTRFICEKVCKVPENAVAHWQDNDMNTFCLRPVESIKAEMKETPVESIKAEMKETPVESIKAEMEETATESIKAKMEETPTESIKAEMEETPAESIKAEMVETPAESIKAEMVETPAESIKAGMEETPAESIKAGMEETPAESIKAEMEEKPFYNAGTSASTWRIGGIFCKVKSWHSGMEQEQDTINFVKKMFKDIPVPNVLYAWTEAEYSRSYLILEPMPGIALACAWDSLSTAQRWNIATQIAGYCSTMATATSDTLQTATGCGILEPRLMRPSDEDLPCWKRESFGPLDMVNARDYFSPVCIGDAFLYYHNDLGPTNILVHDGNVSAILDWEDAAFYPATWMASKPRLSYGFGLFGPDGDPGEDMWAWAILLTQALEERGFVDEAEAFYHWNHA